MNLELDQVRPCRHPGIEERTVVALHDLVAAREVLGHPTAHVRQPLGGESTARTKARVDRCRVAVAEVLDDHVQHAYAPLVVEGINFDVARALVKANRLAVDSAIRPGDSPYSRVTRGERNVSTNALEPPGLNAGRTHLQPVEAPMTLLSARALLPAVLLIGFADACGPRTATARKRNPATPSTVTAEEIERNTGQPIEKVLEGRVSGVTVEQAAGGGIAVRIRGTSSFYGSNEPLYIVDGSPFTPGPGGALTGLNPYDIESIQVLKNPADIGLYGMRGANGVIVIKTKRPR
jgi:TonB-dependent SusC/RagA subfamily outer membrane receptor